MIKFIATVLLTFAAVSESFQSIFRHHAIVCSVGVKTSKPVFFSSNRVVPSPLFVAEVKEVTEYMLGDSPQQLKVSLLEKISDFRESLNNKPDVSFNETRSQTIDFYSISQDVGDKAQEIYDICEKMSDCSPIIDRTKFIGDTKNGILAPLNGPWKSLFSNAVDANFGEDHSTRGSAVAQMLVNATTGRITNVVDDHFGNDKEDAAEPFLKHLSVVLKAMAVSSRRVEFQFKYAKAIFTKFLWFKCRWSLYIPGPIRPFLTLSIAMVNTILSVIGRKSTRIPKKQLYLDVLYLDENVCIHRTGQDNLFVRVRETWNLARPLL
jgi:hypothetical protein